MQEDQDTLDVPSLEEVEDMPDEESQAVEAGLLERTDNGPRPEDGPQPKMGAAIEFDEESLAEQAQTDEED